MSRWFRSLRWRLQVWHALILLLVVVGFGAILHWEVLRGRWADVDSELLAAARILEGVLRQVPRPVLDSLAQELGSPQHPYPRPQRLPREESPQRKRNDGDRLPVPKFDPMRPMRPNVGELQWEGPADGASAVPGTNQPLSNGEPSLSFPTSLTEQLGRGEGRAYFIIWRSDGSVLRESGVPFASRERPDEGPFLAGNSVIRSVRGDFREVTLRGPQSTLISVGRDVTEEFRRLDRFTIQLFVVGTTIMIGGLVGGWWLGRRAVQPIEQMSRTAGTIHASNLSERMDLKNVDIELEQLGIVLNTMLDRIEGAFDQQRQFTADASHELRTPLAIILSSTELALAKPRSADEYREHLSKCHRAAERMRRLVESLLSLARLDASSPSTVVQSDVDLSCLCAESIDALKPVAEKHQVKLSLHADPCVTAGDSNSLAQVILNLVHNAIIYNHSGGTVDVTVRKEDDLCVVRIRDSGIGISETDVPFLFDRFFRVDRSRSRSPEATGSVGGSGLGLAICHRIVTLHRGTLQVSSALGEGSEFIVRLPSSGQLSNILDTVQIGT